ncbi:hypothetical protein K2173_006539 [Erythroxylum novogranatense]|uniref:HMG box domain-containing protein n=1 Tax=Erythroxylum novogranatense TaxID=1862640 RepID=A0AAV8T580_9ROSI|nr:hypothetical protein K2173_006539 [Erythroxylum novogranatense]
MAKKASKSKNSRPSSAPSGSSKAVSTVSDRRMVLRIRSSERMSRSRRLNVVSVDKEKKPKAVMKRKGRSNKKSAKLDAKMPKKPPTAFFYFLEDFRKDFQVQNPDVKSMRDIGKACGEKWKTMTYEEKVKYYDIATEKRADFDRAMAEYMKRKESGEDEDTETDTEFDE